MSARRLTSDLLKIDGARVEEEAVGFIRQYVGEAGADGVGVGLSGGIDSSVAACLCTRAIGCDRVLGVLMPDTRVTPEQDMEDAISLARQLCIRTYLAPIDSVLDAFLSSAPIKSTDRVVEANVRARMRMMTLYYFANSLNYLVAGTGDRSEDLIGYFTKYGDGGVDFLPITHLYKSQVRQMGAHLGLPEGLVTKPSSPQLWPGHRATDEIPVDYDVLDLILFGLFDLKMTATEVAQDLAISIRVVNDILKRFRLSIHKRSYPRMLREW